ncbi:MAG TPA: GDSL-type esterase/lipase family protein [Lysobacter sp.]
MRIRYLALGDSYTIGEGVDAHGRWPVQLAHALREDGLDIAEPRIIATTGWTTDELAAAIRAEQPLGRWDFVTLGIGVNDQYRGRGVAAYREGLTGLLDTALALAGGDAARVMMLSIPDWGVTRFAREQGRDGAAVGAEIDEYNVLAQRLCEARRIAFVDVTRASREDGGRDALLAGDGLHPSAAMYARWTALALPVAHRLLGDGA